MSETLNKAKSLSKFVYIIDTMNEFDHATVVRELGHNNFHLFHLLTYEECKAAIVLVMNELLPEMTGKCAFIISNINVLISKSQRDIVVNPKVQLLDVEVTDEDTAETEKVQIPTEIDAMFKARKLLKDLMYTIRDARKAGIEVDIIEGPDGLPLPIKEAD